LRSGGIEAVYDDIPKPIGMMKFAPLVKARGAMFGAATRVGKASQEAVVLTEKELYGE
jgi:hypothetical protein